MCVSTKSSSTNQGERTTQNFTRRPLHSPRQGPRVWEVGRDPTDLSTALSPTARADHPDRSFWAPCPRAQTPSARLLAPLGSVKTNDMHKHHSSTLSKCHSWPRPRTRAALHVHRYMGARKEAELREKTRVLRDVTHM